MKPAEIINELEKNAIVFKNLFSNISTEHSKWRLSEKKWSLLEIVCHLYDEEIKDFKPRLEKILNEDSDWNPIDPQGWVISEKYSEKKFLITVESFISERKKSVEWLKNLEVIDWNIKAVHLKFGEFTAYQMLCNWLAHDYLHMRQIVKLKYHMLESGLSIEKLGYAGEW